MLERRAEELSGLEGEDFDVVVLNSVVQYFPDDAYLRRVLSGALKCLRTGGAIFVGDVRNLALLEAFHATTELETAPADLSAGDLRRRVLRRMEIEQELLLDPAWFVTFAEQPYSIKVEAWPRRGCHDTELTRFRYTSFSPETLTGPRHRRRPRLGVGPSPRHDGPPQAPRGGNSHQPDSIAPAAGYGRVTRRMERGDPHATAATLRRVAATD